MSDEVRNLTLKENLPLFDGMMRNQTQIIENQKVIHSSMKTLANNQILLEDRMQNFGLSEAKKNEIQDGLDNLTIRSATKLSNAMQDRVERFVKRIESSDQVFIIPQFIFFFSLSAFFGLIVITNALVWDSRMIWQITTIISGFTVITITAVLLAYNYFLKDNDHRRY